MKFLIANFSSYHYSPKKFTQSKAQRHFKSGLVIIGNKRGDGCHEWCPASDGLEELHDERLSALVGPEEDQAGNCSRERVPSNANPRPVLSHAVILRTCA